MSTRKTTSGFTLVEILAVIAIIGLLASVVLFSMQGAREKANDTQRKSDIDQLRIALRIYRDAEGAMPTGDLDQADLNTLLAPYLSGDVKDPLTTSGYGYEYSESSKCGGGKRIIYAKSTQTNMGNWSSVCTGSEPGTDTYVLAI